MLDSMLLEYSISKAVCYDRQNASHPTFTESSDQYAMRAKMKAS